jgi:exonuclease VII small subunit
MRERPSEGTVEELADAQTRLDEAAAALAQARSSTATARQRLQERRAEEERILRAYEEAAATRREAAERSRVSTEQRIEAMRKVDEAESDRLAYEAEWYRRLLEAEKATGGDAGGS